MAFVQGRRSNLFRAIKMSLFCSVGDQLKARCGIFTSSPDPYGRLQDRVTRPAFDQMGFGVSTLRHRNTCNAANGLAAT